MPQALVQSPPPSKSFSSVFSKDEWKDLVSGLEDHFAIFSTLYAVARPAFSTKLPTAAVSFNRAGGCIDFSINPDFWATLNRDQKLFVMSHEALHVFLNHGKRIRDGKPTEREQQNLALDVVINHLLTDKFGHRRKIVDPDNAYCWRDTVFKKPVKPGQNYEYYLTQLREQQKSGGGKDGEGDGQGGESINDHEGLRSFVNKPGNGKPADGEGTDTEKALRDFLKENIGPAQLEELAEKLGAKGGGPGGTMAGTEAGELIKIIQEMKVVPKRKWETVIKQWARQFRTENESAQFVLTNRRYALMPRTDTFLPTDSEHEGWDKGRIEVWFFLDTSGSCVHLAERFFTAAMTLPKDRFDMRLFCFDTKVYDVDLKTRKLSGFGGTSFSCIETAIQQKIAFEGVSYPKAVFLITDGFGDTVAPEHPERWQWFLSYDYRDYLPPSSKVHMLSDFE